MNLLVTVAVVLTYPVQFYPAIEIIEKKLGLVYEEEDDGVHIPMMMLSPPDDDELGELLESPGALDALLAASDDALDRVCEVEGAAEEVPSEPASPNKQIIDDAAAAVPSEDRAESKPNAANLEARALSQSEQQAILSSAADML